MGVINISDRYITPDLKKVRGHEVHSEQIDLRERIFCPNFQNNKLKYGNKFKELDFGNNIPN